MTPELAKQIKAVRKAAAAVRDSMPFDAALLAKIQYVKCRRCKSGLYGTQHGELPCRVCCQGPTPRPGWRPTAESVALMGAIYSKHKIQCWQAEQRGEQEVVRLLIDAGLDSRLEAGHVADLEHYIQREWEASPLLRAQQAEFDQGCRDLARGPY